MANLLKSSKQVLTIVIAFAVLAASLFAVCIVAEAETTDSFCEGTRIEYWDGTQDTSLEGAGTQDNPYIISNAAELNYVCIGANGNSTDKYFVVDPEIGAFILQPQDLVSALGGTSAFTGITSAAQTKELFEVKAAGQALNWLSLYIKDGFFAGHFDGNGVEIYGMYANTTGTTSNQAGLFPVLDGNSAGATIDSNGWNIATKATTVKNFVLKNSYSYGHMRVGSVAGTSFWDGGAAKVNGWVEMANLEVANCFLVGHTGSGEMAIVNGNPNNDLMKVNGLYVHGNETEYRIYAGAEYTVDESKKFNYLFTMNNCTHPRSKVTGEINNVISIGARVDDQRTDDDIDGGYASIVYTDVETALQGATVVETALGDEGVAAMNKLDWKNVWFMGLYGPTFRAFHGTISLVQTETTHCYACEECGFMSYDGEVEHNWDDTYKCTDCDWQCTHGSQTVGEFREGNCVTKDGYYTECNYCEWVSVEYVGEEPAGHSLEWVDEILADCENTGRQGYWHCTKCNSNFTADSEEAIKFADPATSILDPETTLMIPTTLHNARNHEDGSILVFSDETGHWWVCYTCDGRLVAVETDRYAEEGEVKKHNFENGVCVDCDWECAQHDYKSTGVVVVAGSCTVDKEEELMCSICGNRKSFVTEKAGCKVVKVEEVAANDRLEGTKEHYKCSVCQELYFDAEGKTKATEAELVIPKVLPDEYQNVPSDDQNVPSDDQNVSTGDSTINTDTSDKSPSTGDSLASVIAVAALAGVAFVFARKK